MSTDNRLLLTTKFPNLFTKHSSDGNQKLSQANMFMDAIKTSNLSLCPKGIAPKWGGLHQILINCTIIGMNCTKN